MKIEEFFVELNLKRKNWLLCCSYNPKFSQISFHLNETGKSLDNLTSKYDSIILLGDFNTEPTDTILSHFCEIFNFKNLIKGKTCFKNPNKQAALICLLQTGQKVFKIIWLFKQG